MLGAVFGDVIGSVYEVRNVKTKGFPLITSHSRYTDDSVMTLAVAKWLLEDQNHTESGLVNCLQRVGRRHIHAGYGSKFRAWLLSDAPCPYNSWGNGAAMRVSPVGLYAKSIEEALELARITACVTHNHPEGIKGALAVVECVYWNKNRPSQCSDLETTKRFIRDRIEEIYGYDLSRTLNDIRPTYRFDVSCQGSVPEAIIAFLESHSLEDCVRNAISIGGDSDTIAAIACSIFAANSEARNDYLEKIVMKFLPLDLMWIMETFEHTILAQRELICQHQKEEVATQDSWKTMPMGEHVTLVEDLFLPDKEFELLKWGHVPERMEDHWFMYCDEQTIRYYRSWTGHCVYIASYQKNNGGIKINSLQVSVEEKPSNPISVRKDVALFLALILEECGYDADYFWNYWHSNL